MNVVTEIITKANDFLVLASVLATLYWGGYVGKYRDERSYKIIGKSTIISFPIALFCIAFSLIFNLNGKIPNSSLSEYLLFTFTFSLTLFAVSIFIMNRKLSA